VYNNVKWTEYGREFQVMSMYSKITGTDYGECEKRTGQSTVYMTEQSVFDKG
jgi:hypothetical protein